MRVLLIRLRLIGDVVLSTPVIRALRRAFPDATLTYLVERDAAAVVAGNRDLDRIIVVERTRGVRRVLDDVKLAWQLRRDRYEVVIDMHGGPRSSWLTLATGAPQRIGYDMPGREWMYTQDHSARPGAPAAPLGPEPVGPPRGHRGLARGGR